MFQTADLELRKMPGKGLGVFARRPFDQDEVIEVAPVIVVVPADQVPLIEGTPIEPYYYYWGPDLKSAAVMGGYGSFYNHHSQPNAKIVREPERGRVLIVALEHIRSGDEITFNYRAARDDEPQGFEPI